MGICNGALLMTNEKLRQQIVFEAARLMYQRRESDYDRAKMVATRKLCRGWVKRSDLPSDREIREELRRFASVYEVQTHPERFQVYRELLLPLRFVQQDRDLHPEGDVLYHSLQVFERAWQMLPYDEEFLLAALLHDIGKGIDLRDHVDASLQALDGFITERTSWLIEHHVEARGLRTGTIGVRSRRRLMRSESFDELVLLEECDRAGCVSGAIVPDVDTALDRIRALEQ